MNPSKVHEIIKGPRWWHCIKRLCCHCFVRQPEDIPRWWHCIKRLCCHCFVRQPEDIPRDVPKGHVAVYVGEGDVEERVRYVVDISVLGHLLFRSLLDHAAEVFEFSAAAKLCIPCNETVFLGVLRVCSRTKKSGRHGPCFLG